MSITISAPMPGPRALAFPPGLDPSLAALVTAYERARFYHGDATGGTDAEVAGLRLPESQDTDLIGDPATAPRRGGAIRLRLMPDIGAAEGRLRRVFLDAARAGAMLSPPAGFVARDDRIFRDRENGAAVLTLADVPPEAVFGGTLTELSARAEDDPKLIEACRCIASFDPMVPAAAETFRRRLREAVRFGLMPDSIRDEKLTHPLLGP